MEQEEKADLNDPFYRDALIQAMQEVADEERMAEVSTYDEKETHGLKGWETDDAFSIEQDVEYIIDQARIERDMRDDGLIKPEKGVRKFATVPMAAIIDYYNKFGIDILDAETSRDQWEMAKFRLWIQKEHPYFMVREAGKTKFHLTT